MEEMQILDVSKRAHSAPPEMEEFECSRAVEKLGCQTRFT